jgi:energy-coupling factor transporter ATP-binding protein EcfA2
VILDDPLSAVDTPTANDLLHMAILDLLKGRTCILITHATSLVLPYADKCVLLDNGAVVSQGTPQEVMMDPRATGLIEKCDF